MNLLLRARGRFLLLVVLLVGSVVGVRALDVATIATDLPDYYPGDTVLITGNGWQPGETVRLAITQVSPPIPDPTTVFDVVADASGSVTSADFLIQESHLGAAFTLTADGLSSGRHAETTFTDSPLLSTATLSGQNPDPVLSGNDATYSMTINRNPGARNFDVALTTQGLPAGVTATFAPSQVNFGGGDGSRSVNLTLTVGSAVPTGTYTFTAKATVTTNSSDFATANGVLQVLRDVDAPTTIATPSTAPSSYGWFKANVSLNLSASDNDGGSGVKEIVYSASGAQNISTTTVSGSSASLSLTSQGETTVTYFARDKAGNAESAQSYVVRIDKTSPVLTKGATTGTAGSNGWYRSDVSVAYTASDALSGLETTDDASFSVKTTGEGSSVATGSRVVKDRAGNEATAGPHTFKVDKTAPALQQGSVTGTPGTNGWYRSDVSVAFTASDAVSGLASPGDGSFSLGASGEGESVASGTRTVADQAGNSAVAGPLTFKIDKTAPELTEGTATGTEGENGWYWSAVSVGWTALDAVSGLKESSEASFSTTTTGEGASASTGTRKVYDQAGNFAETTARSFKVDLTDPQVTPAPDRAANDNGWYTTSVTVSFQATDGASGVASVSDPIEYSGPDSDSASVVGVATDNSGRTSSATFALKYDATKPQVQISGVDASCLREATLDYEASDLFLASRSLKLNGSALPTTPYQLVIEGTYTLVARAVDQAGNEEVVTATFEIDRSAPVILFGTDWPEEGVYYKTSKMLEFELQDPEASFKTSVLRRFLYGSNALAALVSGSTVSDEGRYLVELLAEDCAGNQTSVSRGFFIDKTAPNVAIEAVGVEGENGWYVGDSLSAQLGAVDPLIRAATPGLDEIAGSGVASLTYGASGATSVEEATEASAGKSLALSEGISTVYVSAVDVAGNASASASKQIKYDKTAPEIEAIADITEEATGPNGAAVTLPTPVANDNLSTALAELSHSSGSTFALGETAVTVTARDEAGNQSQSSFKVKVQDTTAPTFPTPPSNLELEATGPAGAQAIFSLPAATDLVDPSPLVSADHASGATYPIGETTVTVTARDFAGNERTTSFKVKVVDTTPPALQLPADLEIEGNALGGATVTFTATATDLVDGDVAVSTSKASGSLFPLGTTTVNCESTDARGNKATGSFKVKVVDTTAPTFSGVPADMVVEATGPSGAAVSFASPTASDVVSGSVSVSPSHASGSTFPLGITTVTFSAQDGSGNTATTSFQITVRDTTAPVLSLPANIAQIATSAQGNVVTFTSSATDLVSGGVPVVCTPGSGSLFGLGTTTVNCTATDGAGNVATGSFTVTITYAWSNVLRPISTAGDSSFKFGSTVPVKFALTGASAGITDATARLFLVKVDDNPANTEAEAVSTSSATTGNLFRYDPTSDQYVFNLGTKGLSTGRWRLRIDLGDGVARTVEISLK